MGEMAPSGAFRRKGGGWGGEEVVCVEEVSYINDAHEGNVPCHYFIEEEGVSISLILNLTLVEEKQGHTITHFFILPRYVPPTSTKETTINPTIDYSWSWLMTSKKYMNGMVDKARKKAHVKNEGAQKEEELEATKKKCQEDKFI